MPTRSTWSTRLRLVACSLALTMSACRETPGGPDPIAAAIVIVSGDEQPVAWGEVATERLGVRVLDQHGNGVAGAMVNWTLASGGGSLDSSVVITDETGTGYARYAANTSLGVTDARITAATPSISGVTFSLTISGPPDGVTGHALEHCSPSNGQASRPVEVATIINEYLFRGVTGYDAAGRVVPHDPPCSEFTNSASSGYFSFSEFNHNGYHDWAIVTARLRNGADATLAAYGGQLIVSSAYRCPDKQHDVNPHDWFAGGRHMHGDAIDFVTHDLQQWLAVKAAAKAAGACVEPLTASSTDHVHADWRGTCPSGW